MTEDRALKQDIRQRMAATGEKYTEARRAVLSRAHAQDQAAAHGVTLEVARRRTAEVVGDGGRDSVRWQHSPRATVVRKLAEVEAERLGAARPARAHTVLAMLTEGEGFPNALFREVDVDVGKLRTDLLEALDVPHDMREMYLRQRDSAAGSPRA